MFKFSNTKLDCLASDAKPANALNGRGHAPEPTIPEHDAKYVWRFEIQKVKLKT